MPRKPAAPCYITRSSHRSWKEQRFFFCSRRYSHPRQPYLVKTTLLCISFHLPSKGQKFLSRQEVKLWTSSVRNSRAAAFLFRERMSRCRNKSACLKLCCGDVIAVNRDGRWNWKGLSCLSLLDVLCWKCGAISFYLKQPLPAPCFFQQHVSTEVLLADWWAFFELWMAMNIPHLQEVTDDAQAVLQS